MEKELFHIAFEGSWEENPNEPGQLLFNTENGTPIIVCSTAMHLCAIEVHKDENGIQEAVNPAWESDLNGLFLASLDGYFQESEINGKTYVVYMLPHQE